MDVKVTNVQSKTPVADVLEHETENNIVEKDTMEKSTRQFMSYATGAILSALLFAVLQEKTYTIEGFTYGGFLTLLTSLTYCCTAFVQQLWLHGEVRRKASVMDYAKLSMLTMGGMYFTNWSLNYINYPTRIMFKGSKVVPVMITSAIMLGKQYHAPFWIVILLRIEHGLGTRLWSMRMHSFWYPGLSSS
eukprot:m.94680 g.94680  ORF g.94680 m.94680 type:complete len:190 (-) comp13456_c0_seq4:572-1141(-)